MQKDKEVLTVTVDGSQTKGGVVAMVENIRGFIPASCLALSRVENLEDYLNKELRVHIIDVDRDKKRLILSAKSVLQQEAAAAKAEKLAAEDGRKLDYTVADIRKKIYARLPELIDKTIEKLKKFQKPDGSFSYEQHRSAPTTQGVPVSLGVYEGDVNGLACAMHYPLSSIFGVLGINKVPMCNHDDFMRLYNQIDAANKAYAEANK
jgi:predicted RNA-binding protein with RPS1 domain